MRAYALACVIACALAACSTTVSPDEAFSAGTGQSYVLVGVPLDELETHTLTFQRVDLASSTFLRNLVSVKAQPRASERWRRFPQDGGAASLRFGGSRLPPGDYALVSHSRYRYLGSMSMVDVNCYSRGAAIYRFREGAINVVSVPHFIPGWIGVPQTTSAIGGEALQERVAEFLTGYPNMTAPRVVAEPIGTATFETAGKNNCVPNNPASFTRAPAANW